MMANCTLGACGEAKLNCTLDESPLHRLAEPRQPRKKNTPCISDLAGVKFFLKKGKGVFLSGFCLPSIQAGGVPNAIRARQSKTIFAGGKGFALPRLFFQNGWIWISATQECAADSFLIFGRGGLRRLLICDIVLSVKTNVVL